MGYPLFEKPAEIGRQSVAHLATTLRLHAYGHYHFVSDALKTFYLYLLLKCSNWVLNTLPGDRRA
jgi:hypothetical protein